MTDAFVGMQLVVETRHGQTVFKDLTADQITQVLDACGFVAESSQPAEEPAEPPGMALPSVKASPPPLPSFPPEEPDVDLVYQVGEPQAALVETRWEEPDEDEWEDTYEDEWEDTDETVSLEKKSSAVGRFVLISVIVAVLGGAWFVVGVLRFSSPTKPAEAPAEGMWLPDQRARTALSVYPPGTPIIAFYRAFPSSGQHWIAIANAGSPDDENISWTFLDEIQQGKLTFDGLEPGWYELRSYYDWPDSGYMVRERFSFVVQDE
jgi:hypothetical protein